LETPVRLTAILQRKWRPLGAYLTFLAKQTSQEIKPLSHVGKTMYDKCTTAFMRSRLLVLSRLRDRTRLGHHLLIKQMSFSTLWVAFRQTAKDFDFVVNRNESWSTYSGAAW
jgi:hypothetical protein